MYPIKCVHVFVVFFVLFSESCDLFTHILYIYFKFFEHKQNQTQTKKIKQKKSKQNNKARSVYIYFVCTLIVAFVYVGCKDISMFETTQQIKRWQYLKIYSI